MKSGYVGIGAVCLVLAVTACGAQPLVADDKPEWVREPLKSKNLETCKFTSKAVGGEVSYVLFLPPGYDPKGDRRYPVVYWLHGIGGSQAGLPRFAERLTSAIMEKKAPPMLVVFVNGVKDSFYCDATDGSRPVESAIVKDLIPHIDKTHLTVAKREGRMVEGFSMGGFGAAHLGFKYPDLFGSISVIDAALVTPDTMAKRHADVFKRMFGSSRETFEKEHPTTLAEKNGAAVRDRTTVRLIVGALQAPNEQFHGLLTKLKVAHDYEKFPEAGHDHAKIYDKLGDKNWAYYRKAFEAAVKR